MWVCVQSIRRELPMPLRGRPDMSSVVRDNKVSIDALKDRYRYRPRGWG